MGELFRCFCAPGHVACLTCCVILLRRPPSPSPQPSASIYLALVLWSWNCTPSRRPASYAIHSVRVCPGPQCTPRRCNVFTVTRLHRGPQMRSQQPRSPAQTPPSLPNDVLTRNVWQAPTPALLQKQQWFQISGCAKSRAASWSRTMPQGH